jgi:hypothetical protein
MSVKRSSILHQQWHGPNMSERFSKNIYINQQTFLFQFRLFRVSTSQLLSTCTSVLALKYEYELNCQEKSKFRKFISKRRIISLRHSIIYLRQINTTLFWTELVWCFVYISFNAWNMKILVYLIHTQGNSTRCLYYKFSDIFRALWS